MQDVGIEAISIHGRTRKQMYKGEADWSLIAAVKENPRIKIPVFGNGDVDSPMKALEYRNRYGVDGIMIGRASIGYPWVFREIKHFLKTGEILPPATLEERITASRRHLEMAVEWKGERLGVVETRRHWGTYFKGIPNFKAYRTELVTQDSSAKVFKMLDRIAHDFKNFEMRHASA